MADKVRVLVVGMGNMGISHAKAYHELDGFEIAGLCSRGIDAQTNLPPAMDGYRKFSDYARALAADRSVRTGQVVEL